MSITLEELKTQSRQLADMSDNEFISDSELTNYINFAISELHDMLVENYESEYFLSTESGTTVSGTAEYALPTNFYKLRGVDIKLNGTDWFSINAFNFNERNRYEEFGSWSLQGISNVRYRVMGSNIRFSPVPDNALPYKIWYIPVATKLVSDSDTLDDINQFSDFVILTAAMKMLIKEESDVSVLQAERNRIEQKIRQASENRDAGQPASISDIYAENNDFLYTRGRS
jgi:hypothetical protein